MSKYKISISLLFLFLCFGGKGIGEPPSHVAIIGGLKENKPYASFVQPDGTLITLTDEVFNEKGRQAKILSVGINQLKMGVIGGIKGMGTPYVALFNSDGKTIPLRGDALPQGGSGAIYSVAINESGRGIIGGVEGIDKPYAALFSSNGQTIPIKGAALPKKEAGGAIYTVGMNESGSGVIGGVHNTYTPYAALVKKDGTTVSLKGLAIPNQSAKGKIQSVAINGSGCGIIGGIENNNQPYAALFSVDGTTTFLKGKGAPKKEIPGSIESVAINAFGAGIIGGQEENKPYAALVSHEGNATRIDGKAFPTTTGRIQSVAINTGGNSIVGGVQDHDKPYAALIGRDGTLTPLKGGGSPQTKVAGSISSVKIDDSGIALIGGSQGTNRGYSALIAPDGTATELKLHSAPPSNTIGLIRTVALNELGVGILAGEYEEGKNENLYYAGLMDRNGQTTLLTQDPFFKTKTAVNAVAINGSGNGLIGGIQGVEGGKHSTLYAAFIRTNNTITPLTLDTYGSCKAVAINPNGDGIIGGKTEAGDMYAILVDKTGKITRLTGDAALQEGGSIECVAINPNGDAIIGGNQKGDTYATLVDKNGKVTSLTGDAAHQDAGNIYSVAINPSGDAIIGGTYKGDIYAALVDKTGKTTTLSGDAAPKDNGNILSVAINRNGDAIIGGDQKARIYAALVDKTGKTTPLSVNPTPHPEDNGSIYSVAINSDGNGIIGGTQNDSSYVVLVDKIGKITPLTGEVPEGAGIIQSVAINDSGVALIGGQHRSQEIYAAIVAPNGRTSLLWNTLFQPQGSIYAVDFAHSHTFSDQTGLNQINPKSFGIGTGYADALFPLSKLALGEHLNYTGLSVEDPSPFTLVADGSTTFSPSFEKKPKGFNVWGSPFIFYSHREQEKDFSPLSHRGLGGMMGIDYSGFNGQTIGAGLAYVYQNGENGADGARSQIHQEFATVYASYTWSPLFFEGALWGGLSQIENHRLTMGFIPSESFVKGTLLSPHLKIGSSFRTKILTILPFVAFDWANYWQFAVEERGQSGLNLCIGSHYASLFRSEIGVQFAETIELSNTVFTFRQEVSYVNQLPFGNKTAAVHYVQSSGTFPVTLSSKRTEHLAGLFLSGRFASKKEGVPTVSFSYQGELGLKKELHSVMLECSKAF